MSKNKLYAFGFFLAAILFATSYYIEYFQNIKPCLLCLLQRWFFLGITILFLLSFLFRKLSKLNLVISLLNILFILLGILAAGRQVWLEHQPQSMDMTCLPDIHYLITHLPIQTVFKMMLIGSSDCGQINFVFLGSSLAAWSLVGFIICLVIVVLTFRRD